MDTNICIAAGWPFKQVITYSDWNPVASPYPVPEQVITNYLESKDFYFTPTAGHFSLLINFADFDDKGTIGSIASSGPVTSCTYAGQITNTMVPPGDITVTNNRLQVRVTATDDTNCHVYIGWRTITLTWQAWPAP